MNNRLEISQALIRVRSSINVEVETLFERRVFGELVETDVGGNVFGRALTVGQIGILIARGMRGSYLRRLSDGIPRRIIAATLCQEISSFSKLYQSKLSKIQTDRLNELTVFWKELREFFEDNDELLIELLDSSVPALVCARAADLASTISGRQELRRVLDSMRYGEFT